MLQLRQLSMPIEKKFFTLAERHLDSSDSQIHNLAHTCGVPLAQAKALGNSRSFLSRRPSARNEFGEGCGSALPGPSTRSAPVAKGICFSRASSLII